MSREQTMRALPLVLLVAASSVAGALGCGSSAGGDAVTGDEEEVKERNALFGDDRVGAALKTHLDQVPGTYAEFEKVFKVGRQCARTDSKEIFVVEESQSRVSGEQKPTTGLLPRAVITGCNTDRANPDAVKNSFSLMAALVSSPDAPAAGKGDAMVFTPVEVMSLDERTGTYNFYVFESNGAGKPGTITRLMRDAATGATRELRLTPGGRVTKQASATKRCFSCHVNGGPLMNEMRNPWTNWVSTRNTLPKGSFTGETFSMVSEAAPIDPGHARSSLANDLEQTMTSAMRVWVNGSSPTTGFGLMTLEGSAPGGLPLLMKSVFCQTELNFASANDLVPMELFIDPAAAVGSGLVAPAPYASEVFPTLLPVRSEHDKRIEIYLQKVSILTPKTVLATRLIDDEHDIFSTTRCDVLPKVLEALPTDRTKVDAYVRAIVAQKLKDKAFGTLSTARADYMAKLLDDKTTDTALATAKDAYFVDLKSRFDKAAAQITTATGRTKLKARVTAEKASAKAMFPDAANPLPILE